MNSPSLPAWSLRTRLLAGILLPILLCISWNTWVVYHEALGALHTAYDRTLLASAKTIGEQLDVQGYEAHATISATVPYSALEAFEADTQTRMFYRLLSVRAVHQILLRLSRRQRTQKCQLPQRTRCRFPCVFSTLRVSRRIRG